MTTQEAEAYKHFFYEFMIQFDENALAMPFDLCMKTASEILKNLKAIQLASEPQWISVEDIDELPNKEVFCTSSRGGKYNYASCLFGWLVKTPTGYICWNDERSMGDIKYFTYYMMPLPSPSSQK